MRAVDVVSDDVVGILWQYGAVVSWRVGGRSRVSAARRSK